MLHRWSIWPVNILNQHLSLWFNIWSKVAQSGLLIGNLQRLENFTLILCTGLCLGLFMTRYTHLQLDFMPHTTRWRGRLISSLLYMSDTLTLLLKLNQFEDCGGTCWRKKTTIHSSQDGLSYRIYKIRKGRYWFQKLATSFFWLHRPLSCLMIVCV